MAVKAISYKKWCTDNITPQAWSRLLLRAIDVIRKEGKTIKDLEEPDPSLELSPELIAVLNEAMMGLYEMKIEEAAISS
jgi:hypothetical protein